MESYEERRETGWKTFYGGDPAFVHGESPAAKVISYFVKRKPNEPEVNLVDDKEIVEKGVDYDLMVNVKWLDFNLKRVLRYKKKWYGDTDIYKYVVLVNYVDQCKKGKYTKCIISKQEYMLVKPQPKKK
jgi:hypothetical protein